MEVTTKNRRTALAVAGFAFALTAVAVPLLAASQEQPPAAQPPAKTGTDDDSLRKARTGVPDDSLKPMIGTTAPEIKLPDQNGKIVDVTGIKGKWKVIAFYPVDMTAGCTFQNKSYSANVDKFAALNAVVFTVSTQDTKSKQEFCSKEGLKHTLLSDVGGKVATRYNVAMDNARFGKIAKRYTFYLDPENKIRDVDTKIEVQRAAEESLETLAKLQK
jgi:thioredoxin-dependent peroxiredoxin